MKGYLKLRLQSFFILFFFLSYICSCRDPDVDVSGAATAIIIVASVKSPDNIQENTTKIQQKYMLNTNKKHNYKQTKNKQKYKQKFKN